MARSPELECTDGRFCKKAHGPSSGPRGKMSVPFTPRQMSAIRSAFSTVGLAGVRGAVDGADRCAEDPVGPDAAPDELLQHADLDRAPAAAAGEDEGGAFRGHVL